MKKIDFDNIKVGDIYQHPKIGYIIKIVEISKSELIYVDLPTDLYSGGRKLFSAQLNLARNPNWFNFSECNLLENYVSQDVECLDCQAFCQQFCQGIRRVSKL